MLKSPFKFLDSYTLEDRAIFFGRDQEITELYRRVFESKILLVYGVSGTGKSSLINCGLASRFDDSDWLPVNVRRGNNIVESLKEAFNKQAISPFKKNLSIAEKFQSIYLDHFKPVYLIFDQFEELFIFGSAEEKSDFIKLIKELVDSKVQCRVIFVIREEFLAGITEFENDLPEIFTNRFRVEKMKRANAIQAVEGPCKVYNIETETGFSEELVDKLCPTGNEIELTFLQIYLDRIFRIAANENLEIGSLRFSKQLLSRAGSVSDLLGQFLEEQIGEMEDPNTATSVLKSFVSIQGTKKQMTESDISDSIGAFGKVLTEEELLRYLEKFVELRILRERDESGHFELRHDGLALKIFEKFTAIEKDIIEVRLFIENSFSVYLKREKLLSLDDLKYIAPYEDKLYLNEELTAFVNKSKSEIERSIRMKRFWWVSAGVFIILCSVIFGLISYKNQKEAQLQVKIQKSIKLANASELVLEKDPTLAYLLAEKASDFFPTNESKRSLINAYLNGPFYRTLEGDKSLFSPTKNYIATIDYESNKIRIYKYNGELLGTCSTYSDEILFSSISFIHNEEYIISASLKESTIRVFDIKGIEVFKTKLNKYDDIPVIDFSEKGNIILSFKRCYKIYNSESKLIDSISHDNILGSFPGVRNKNEIILIYSDGMVELRDKDSFSLIKEYTLNGFIALETGIKEWKGNEIVVTNNKCCYILNLDNNTVSDVARPSGSYILRTFLRDKFLINMIEDNGKFYYEIFDMKGKLISRIKDYRKETEIFQNQRVENISKYLDDSTIIVLSNERNTLRYSYYGKLLTTFKGTSLDRNGSKLITYKEDKWSNKVLVFDLIHNEKITEFINGNNRFKLTDSDLIYDGRYVYDLNKNKYKISIGPAEYLMGTTFVSGGERYLVYGGEKVYYKIWNPKISNLPNFSYGNDIDTATIESIQISLSQTIDTVILQDFSITSKFSNTGKYILALNTNRFEKVELWNKTGGLIKSIPIVADKWSDYGFIESNCSFSKNDKYLTLLFNQNNKPRLFIYGAPEFTERFSLDIEPNTRTGFTTNEDTLIIYSGNHIQFYDQNFKLLGIWKVSKLLGSNWTDLPDISFPFIYGFRGKKTDTEFILSDSLLVIYNLCKRDSLELSLEDELKVRSSDPLSANDIIGNFYFKLNDSTGELFIFSGRNKTIKKIDLASFKENVKKVDGDQITDISIVGNLAVMKFVNFHSDYDSQIGRITRMADLSYFKIISINDFKPFSQITSKNVFDSRYLSAGIIYNWDEMVDIYGKKVFNVNTNMLSPTLTKDGKYMIFSDRDSKRLVVVPLSIDEIIRKVRIEKEFGEIRGMTDNEKSYYEIEK